MKHHKGYKPPAPPGQSAADWNVARGWASIGMLIGEIVRRRPSAKVEVLEAYDQRSPGLLLVVRYPDPEGGSVLAMGVSIPSITIERSLINPWPWAQMQADAIAGNMAKKGGEHGNA